MAAASKGTHICRFCGERFTPTALQVELEQESLNESYPDEPASYDEALNLIAYCEECCGL
jgi:hypothetical protein